MGSSGSGIRGRAANPSTGSDLGAPASAPDAAGLAGVFSDASRARKAPSSTLPTLRRAADKLGLWLMSSPAIDQAVAGGTNRPILRKRSGKALALAGTAAGSGDAASHVVAKTALGACEPSMNASLVKSFRLIRRLQGFPITQGNGLPFPGKQRTGAANNQKGVAGTATHAFGLRNIPLLRDLFAGVAEKYLIYKTSRLSLVTKAQDDLER